MPIFAVKRNLPGISMTDLGHAQKLAIETCEKMTSEGTPVTYIRSNFFPAESTCICLFEADEAETVHKVIDDAPTPYDEVTEVIDLPHP